VVEIISDGCDEKESGSFPTRVQVKSAQRRNLIQEPALRKTQRGIPKEKD